MINNGVQVRICSIFTAKNVHEMVDIGNWAHEHGAISYAPSVAVGLGRASKNTDTIITDPKDLSVFTEQKPRLLSVTFFKSYTRLFQRLNCGI